MDVFIFQPEQHRSQESDYITHFIRPILILLLLSLRPMYKESITVLRILSTHFNVMTFFQLFSDRTLQTNCFRKENHIVGKNVKHCNQGYSYYVFLLQCFFNLIITLFYQAPFMILAYCVKVPCTPTARGNQGPYPGYFLEMEATCFETC